MSAFPKESIFKGQFSSPDAQKAWLAEALKRPSMPDSSKTASDFGKGLSPFPQNLLTATGDTFKAMAGIGKIAESSELRHALGDVTHNIAVTLTQDTGSLKKNAALIATLIHVLMRVKEAYDSSNAETKDPKEREYNQEQSAMTYFRELIGFTTGFVLLKRLQGIFEKQITKHHQYQEQKFGGASISQNIKNAVGLLNGNVKPSDIKRIPNALVTETALHRMHANPVNLGLAQIGYALNNPKLETDSLLSTKFWKRAWNMKFGKEAETLVREAVQKKANPQDMAELTQRLLKYEKDGLKLVQKQVPVYLGLIPSILISGFGIEYASLHYGPLVKKNMLTIMRALHVIPQENPDKKATTKTGK
ncbi:MAG: hypothetical protein LW809_01385 [Vampirovibrionales bacterium]|jgi:hypothetical protein|nr:hypothetical protein [Vampirovibrionales bacterium]